jgi:hypothetical protein
MWVPGIATLVALPLGLLVYVVPIKQVAIWTMIPALAIASMYFGPTYSITHCLVGPRERALAGALLLFIINLVGLGLGPLMTGILSDLLKNHFVAQGQAELAAAASGLRWALATMVCVNIWSAFHYIRAARTLREDLIV